MVMDAVASKSFIGAPDYSCELSSSTTQPIHTSQYHGAMDSGARRLAEVATNAGRCGPLYDDRVCDGFFSARQSPERCDQNSGWCTVVDTQDESGPTRGHWGVYDFMVETVEPPLRVRFF
eukprot:COSAG06_NODE_23187_length_700_cov_0.940100_1_plen_119_part_01